MIDRLSNIGILIATAILLITLGLNMDTEFMMDLLTAIVKSVLIISIPVTLSLALYFLLRNRQ